MALADPQVITVNAVAKSMPRIFTSSVGNKTSAEYSIADGTFDLIVSHQTNADGRIRSLIRFQQKAVVQNPLDLTNDYDTMSFQIVCDRPSFGFTQTQMDQLWAGFKAWLDSTMIGKIYGRES
jgi:hypothetical protein